MHKHQFLLVRHGSSYRFYCNNKDKFFHLPQALAIQVLDNAMKRRGLPCEVSNLAKQYWRLELIRSELQNSLTYWQCISNLRSAVWEINKLCNYDCLHCYLGKKENACLDGKQRSRILGYLYEIGAYKLKVTGGEPFADPGFSSLYTEAWQRGFILTIATNASLLALPKNRSLIERYPPLSLVISIYGATESTYEALTQGKQGAFKEFLNGIKAARRLGVKMYFNIILTNINCNEQQAMIRLAESFSGSYRVCGRITPTYFGDRAPTVCQIETPIGSPIQSKNQKVQPRSCGAGASAHGEKHYLK